MTTVDDNRLKGNYATAYVSARLGALCLVRPVAADTDIGVDLYCETVEDNKPFLHFWLQVKAGNQCKTTNSTQATCRIEHKHLTYWNHQPVPVFIALVPLETWPVVNEPDIYIVDVTHRLLNDKLPEHTNEITLHSTSKWSAGNSNDIQQFIEKDVPTNTALLQCRNGIVQPIPSLVRKYVQPLPSEIPISRYIIDILTQLRRTAAFSIIMNDSPQKTDLKFMTILNGIVEQFNDNHEEHWENFAAQAYFRHYISEFETAVELYEKAIQCIKDDSDVTNMDDYVNYLTKRQTNATNHNIEPNGPVAGTSIVIPEFGPTGPTGPAGPT